MASLVERFGVPVEHRGDATALLTIHGHEVLDVEQGGAEFDREDRPWAVLVVRSADDVQKPTPELRMAFAQAVADLFETEDVPYRLVAWPGHRRA